MRKGKTTLVKSRETVGGYPSGDRLISELKPPPPGPAPGAKSKPSSAASGKDGQSDSDSGAR